MGTSGASRWPWDFAERDAAGMGRSLQMALGDTEAALLRSAAWLRVSGRAGRARQVERLAGWARFDLDEPVVAQELYAAAARLWYVRRVESLADQVLELVLSLARADRGNVQLANPASG